MASNAMDYENAPGDRYDDMEPSGYERDGRSASPRPARDDGHDSSRRRSRSPAGNGADRGGPNEASPNKNNDEGATNPGSNLFVTGIHPRLTEEEVVRMFSKYGEVEKAQIMRDPHTKESRGFGFVKMVTSEAADAAKEGLQGEHVEGRTLSIEKARRVRPRTPTPGKYFGPPKREPRARYGGDRFDDRRPRGGYGGGRDDSYRYRGGGGGGYPYERRYDEPPRGYREDRGYDRSYPREDRSYDRRDRDDGYGRGYGGGRDDRDRGYGGPRGGPPRERYGERDGPRRDGPPPSYSESRPEREPYDGRA